MNRQAELSAAYVRVAIQSGVTSADTLLAGSNLTEESLTNVDFVSATDLAIVFRNYDACMKNRAWTAELGAQLNMAAHGPLGFAAISAPTLGAAFEVMGSLSASRSTATQVEAASTKTHFMLLIDSLVDDAEFSQWIVEVLMKISEVFLAMMLGHRVGKNVLIEFAHGKPQGGAQLEKAFDAHVEFGRPRNSIAVPLAWCHLPSPLHDEAAYRANMIKCRELIAQREQVGSSAFRVRSALYNHFDQQMLREGNALPPPTLEEISAKLLMTSRTLIRRLQKENTSYKEILETQRREYAEKLLPDARLQVAEVAEILGYREAANFGRAFKRWYGVSPATWRRS